ncbi:MAG: hypothetical protein OXT09_13860 [Myxococcales bacterium]|nr:hypothetical protein [Myxococcales bacterium]
MRAVTVPPLVLLLVACATANGPAAAGSASPAAAAPVPFDTRTPQSFGAWARAELARADSTLTVERGEDDLAVRVTRADAVDLRIWLGRPYEYCQSGADDCEQMARHFITSILESARSAANPQPARPEQLMPAIRGAADVAAYRENSPDALIEPLVGDLFVVYMIDGPNTASGVGPGTLEELGMDREQAKARALDNLRAQLGGPEKYVKPVQAPAMGYVDFEHYYVSSLLLPHQAWAPVVEAMGGELLVSVPAPEILLYANGGDPGAVMTLGMVSQEVSSKAQRGISATVLRWTPEGWQVATNSK